MESVPRVFLISESEVYYSLVLSPGTGYLPTNASPPYLLSCQRYLLLSLPEPLTSSSSGQAYQLRRHPACSIQG